MLWVKKTFSKAQWDKWCANNPGYVMIQAGQSGDVTAAFIVGQTTLPRGCAFLTPTEERFVDDYCKRTSMYPSPITKKDDNQ